MGKTASTDLELITLNISMMTASDSDTEAIDSSRICKYPGPTR